MIKKFGKFLLGLLFTFVATLCFDWGAVWLIQSYVFGFCMGFVSLFVFWMGVAKMVKVFAKKDKEEDKPEDSEEN